MALRPTPYQAEIRTRLGLSAVATSIGIALSVVGQAGLGAWITVGGLATLIWTVHKYGRVGPDEPGPHPANDA